MKFKLKSENKVIVLDDEEKEVGHIFSPAGTVENCMNAIQICGFTEAFDLWACGVYEHKKDIQLLFDNRNIEGVFDPSPTGCLKCFHNPCQCENDKFGDITKLMLALNAEQRERFTKLREQGDIDKQVKFLVDCQRLNPFNVKRTYELEGRIKYKKWTELKKND